MKAVQIHPHDCVAVALEAIAEGTTVPWTGGAVTALEDIPLGHKIALRDIAAGEPAVKYGCRIGTATRHIPAGAWVHTHNLRTALTAEASYTYRRKAPRLPEVPARTFCGYRRGDGRVGIRNELWIIPLVGCVNAPAQHLARDNQHLVSGSIDGLYAFAHPFGCSQVGDDLAQTRRILAGLARHPNAGGVLILGLGCENLTMEQFQAELGQWDPERIRFLRCQDVTDELAEGSRLLAELAAYAAQFRREELSAAGLTAGLKCGGSDGLSGITANPAVGRFSDQLIAMGGSALLTEVPEMFGAEPILFDRCTEETVFRKAAAMAEDFRRYFTSHGQPVYENPSPGNREGGITTLEEKSCGCVQKGGSAPIRDVLCYGEQLRAQGLNLLSGPGNDLVSTTALTAAGAHLILFTTGRGTPFGAPAPTIKISTNTALYEKKPGWIDLDAGPAVCGEPLESVAGRIMDLVLETASGARTKAEQNNAREIALFKDGVVL